MLLCQIGLLLHLIESRREGTINYFRQDYLNRFGVETDNDFGFEIAQDAMINYWYGLIEKR